MNRLRDGSPKGRVLRRWVMPVLVSAALVVVLGGVLVGGAVAWITRDLVLDAAGPDAPSGALIEAADGSVIGWRGELRAAPARRDDLPEHLVSAVLAIEDRRFYQHRGLDLRGIGRAAWRNLVAGGVTEGGSTISQQLAKVVYLDTDRTLRRKLEEAAIALWLETRLSKDEILTRYLNDIYLGAGTVGIVAAARAYFDKLPEALTLAESAMLAGLIRAPSRANPLHNLDDAQARAATVLAAMAEVGFVTAQQAAQAQAAPANPSPTAPRRDGGGWFADWAFAEARARQGPQMGSVRLRSTLDPVLQALAERIIAQHLPETGAPGGPDEMALVAMTLDGSVVAMVGGRDYAQSQFNRAVQARRQPGSAFKLFVYLAALRQDWALEDKVLDAPLTIDGWTPQNYGGTYRGEVTLRQAFVQSLNTPTVRLAQAVGIDNVVSAARDLGIDAALDENLGLSLGTAGVGLLDLTGAFASVAARRSHVEPFAIAQIEPFRGTHESWLRADGAQRTLPLDHHAPLRALLEGVVQDGTGRRAALDGFVAGKTGTSQAHRDAWFVGFTDQLVVGVWVGNDDDTPMPGITGGDLPARIWQAFVSQATGLSPVDLGPPVPEPPVFAPDPQVTGAVAAPVVRRTVTPSLPRPAAAARAQRPQAAAPGRSGNGNPGRGNAGRGNANAGGGNKAGGKGKPR